jgi:hypothetical protein
MFTIGDTTTLPVTTRNENTSSSIRSGNISPPQSFIELLNANGFGTATTQSTSGREPELPLFQAVPVPPLPQPGSPVRG